MPLPQALPHFHVDCQAEVVFDRAALLQRLEGDRALLRELLEIFLAHYPQHLARLREAIMHQDGTAFAWEIITLKGMLGNLSATEAYEAVRQLETLGYGADLGRALAACGVLQDALRRFAATLWMFSQAVDLVPVSPEAVA